MHKNGKFIIIIPPSPSCSLLNVFLDPCLFIAAIYPRYWLNLYQVIFLKHLCSRIIWANDRTAEVDSRRKKAKAYF